jgi:hypothetical protein
MIFEDEHFMKNSDIILYFTQFGFEPTLPDLPENALLLTNDMLDPFNENSVLLAYSMSCGDPEQKFLSPEIFDWCKETLSGHWKLIDHYGYFTIPTVGRHFDIFQVAIIFDKISDMGSGSF